jgi:hypothetical protein
MDDQKSGLKPGGVGRRNPTKQPHHNPTNGPRPCDGSGAKIPTNTTNPTKPGPRSARGGVENGGNPTTPPQPHQCVFRGEKARLVGLWGWF